ncbi:MAG: hypothetical protein U0892_15285 [Pirellulales bacterium]
MMRRSNGTTLTEVTMALAAGSTVCLAAIGFVHQVFRIEATTRLRSANEHAAARLSQQWRADARIAERVESLSDGPLSIVTSDGSNIQYRIDNRHVIRTVTGAALPKAHHEAYAVAEESEVEFQRKSDPERIVLLMHKRVAESAQPAGVDLEVEAVVGKWSTLGIQVREPNTK